MELGLGCGLGLRVWLLLLEGFVGFAGRLGALSWRAGERLGWKVGSAGLSTGAAFGEGGSGFGWRA